MFVQFAGGEQGGIGAAAVLLEIVKPQVSVLAYVYSRLLRQVKVWIVDAVDIGVCQISFHFRSPFRYVIRCIPYRCCSGALRGCRILPKCSQKNLRSAGTRHKALEIEQKKLVSFFQKPIVI